MKLRIRRAHAEAMAREFPHLASLREQLRFGEVAEWSFQQLTYSELGFLAALYQAAGPELHAQSAILLALQKVRQGNDPRFEPDDDLERLLPALAGLLIEDAIRG